MRGGPRQSTIGSTVRKAPAKRSAATSQAVIACATEKRETMWKLTQTNRSSTAHAQPTRRSPPAPRSSTSAVAVVPVAARQAAPSPPLLPPLRRRARQQEFAPDLHPRLAVIGDDVGGGVGLAPGLGDEAAGADHVDRRPGLGHHPALGDAEAGGGDDAHVLEAGARPAPPACARWRRRRRRCRPGGAARSSLR